MIFYVYDKDLTMTGAIDDADSAIWTERYYKAGDFELYLSAASQAAGLLKEGSYVKREDKDSLCVIERVELQEDAENGDRLLTSGRDLKSLLDRRIVWEQTSLDGDVEECMRRLVLENAIETAPERVIPGLILGPKGPPSGEALKKQITGANLMTAIEDICVTYQWGWDVLFQEGKFAVVFYKGTDRSYSQTGTDNPCVTFSAEFDNLASSVYARDAGGRKNVALVAGEGEGMARRRTTVGQAAGLDRYELYVDARDVSSNEGAISEADYLAQLYGRGVEKLEACQVNETFEGEVDNTDMYVCGKDYFLGDIVTVQNKYGIMGSARVTEMIECWDENGYTAAPTFETWKEGGASWR